MRKLNTLVWLAVALTATAVVHAHLDGPPPGYTGAPGEGTCDVAGCHHVSSGLPGGILVRNSGPQHQDTTTYIVSLICEVFRDYWGFQLIVLDSLDQPFGEILVLDSVRTKVTTDPGGRIYLSHTPAGVFDNSGNWTDWYFRWVRPPGAAITDPISFHASGLMADGDGTRANDAAVTSLSVGPFCVV